MPVAALLRLRDFTLQEVRKPFRHVGHAFAISGTEVLYLQDGLFMLSELDLPQEQQAAKAVDEQGVALSLDKDARTAATGRGSSFLVETETALYELIR